MLDGSFARLLLRGLARWGLGACAHPSVNSLAPHSQMKWHFVQGSMESRHFESWSASLGNPEPPLPLPHFEKSGYAPAFT